MYIDNIIRILYNAFMGEIYQPNLYSEQSLNELQEEKRMVEPITLESVGAAIERIGSKSEPVLGQLIARKDSRGKTIFLYWGELAPEVVKNLKLDSAVSAILLDDDLQAKCQEFASTYFEHESSIHKTDDILSTEYLNDPKPSLVQNQQTEAEIKTSDEPIGKTPSGEPMYAPDKYNPATRRYE